MQDHEYAEHIFQKLQGNDENDLDKNEITHSIQVGRITEQIQS